MDPYVTGNKIRTLRENLGMTQAALAAELCVSDKTVSKWETGRGYPDITLLEPLAAALHASLPELLSGNTVNNTNRHGNMLRSCLYVCPVCGNILHTTGETSVSCCGITLPALEAEAPDEEHQPKLEQVEDETYVTVDHPMTKSHYLSFLAYASGDRFDMIKLYPEGNAEARFKFRGHGWLYLYCNHHGLMRIRV